MIAECITVGVYALDQVLLPRGTAVKGWAARMAEAGPILNEAAKALPVQISVSPDGWVLAVTVDLGGTRHHAGTRIAVDAVETRPGLFLVRFAGKAVAVASAHVWPSGSEHPAGGADRPEVLAAYVSGTLIDTPDGPRPVESLAAGDMVTTLSNGSRPLRWVGRQRIAQVEMLAHPGLCPVEFAPGAIGNARALLVSPQQRMLIDDWRAAVYFGEDRVLVAAQALVDDQAARVVFPTEGLDYVVLLCDRHEVLLAEGALSESFHPGESGLSALHPVARAEIATLVPEAELMRRRAAFPIVRNAEARALRLSR
jgi:Hint domain